MSGVRLKIAGAAVLLALGVGFAVVMTARADTSYETPQEAVLKSCHAVALLGNYTPTASTNIRVGWQELGDAPGFGWVAMVKSVAGGYRVSQCRYQGVAHG